MSPLSIVGRLIEFYEILIIVYVLMSWFRPSGVLLDVYRTLGTIVEPWLGGGWCRRFVVNLKFGRADAVGLLGEVRTRLASRCARLAVRHLFHDREEFTLAGETAH